MFGFARFKIEKYTYFIYLALLGSHALWKYKWRYPVMSPSGSLATNQLATKRSNLATKHQQTDKLE